MSCWTRNSKSRNNILRWFKIVRQKKASDSTPLQELILLRLFALPGPYTKNKFSRRASGQPNKSTQLRLKIDSFLSYPYGGCWE